jgi:ABC-2 type transport system ATP-binding protein
MTSLLPATIDGTIAVRTRALVKRFGKVEVLRGVDLTVPREAVYLLAGPDGAGKSTLLAQLLHLAMPASGEIEALGVDVLRHAPDLRARAAYMPPPGPLPHGWFTVRQCVAHHAAYFTSWDAGYALRLQRRLEVLPDRRLRDLSTGELRRLQLVLALSSRPELLVLDEPTEGIDLLLRERVLHVVAEHLAEWPATVIIATHAVRELERLADHVGIMRDGRIVAQLARDDLHARLRRYRFDVAPGWQPAAGLLAVTVARRGDVRDADWVMWGDEAALRASLGACGATVREARPLALEEAVLTLVTEPEAST